MGLRNVNFKRAYDSDSDDILWDFYIPALSESVEYKRLAGFFSSSSLAAAAHGISKFILNGGHMRLVASVALRKEDVEAIEMAHKDPGSVVENVLLENLEDLESEFVRDHVRALGWMIAHGSLEIKVAVIRDSEGHFLESTTVAKRGIFHQKVGILKDKEGDKISFSGSDNESASSWQENIEEFKVFRSWDKSEREYLESDDAKFEKFWSGESRRVWVMDVPEAVRRKLVEVAPEKLGEINLGRWSNTQFAPQRGAKSVQLYGYQLEAINKWLGNNKKGVFEMATGTGKTLTALGCLDALLRRKENPGVAIAVPYAHLSGQWKTEAEKFGLSLPIIYADSAHRNWKNELANILLDFKHSVTKGFMVLTTHVTLSSTDFISIVTKSGVKPLFLIVDEVHWTGAPELQKGLLENYTLRLGLSATPSRWLDLEGTEVISNYFGKTVYEFPLKRAVEEINPATGKTFLTPYNYYPSFVELTGEEMEDYISQTKKISNAYYRGREDDQNELLRYLLIKRRKIVINAHRKYDDFKKILDGLERGGGIRDCLIYCSPQQIEEVQATLNAKGVVNHKFTGGEGVSPEKKYMGISEREFLLRKFSDGDFQALVAMKCLDEGVDVPSAKIAIFLASSGNPKQFIQRRGRILRRFEGKKKADIYDIIVMPDLKSMHDSQRLKLEKRIMKSELDRYYEFVDAAKNKLECWNTVMEIEKNMLLCA